MIHEIIRQRKPLIHCITNPISINQCANLILAIGCRPIMAEHPAEVREITRTSASLLLNLGNIPDARMESIPLAADEAAHSSIPIVLDAVGVACSSLRRGFVYDFLKTHTPTVLKGNYSEIKALYDAEYLGVGVDADSSLTVPEISTCAIKLSRKHNCIILASGKTDIVTDGKRMIHISNGCMQLGKITGSGCMLGAAVACFLTESQSITAAAHACAFLGICGELSESELGCGTFSAKLMDKLSTLTPAELEKYMKMEEIDVENL